MALKETVLWKANSTVVAGQSHFGGTTVLYWTGFSLKREVEVKLLRLHPQRRRWTACWSGCKTCHGIAVLWFQSIKVKG